MKKIIIIDGSSYFFRAFFAIQHLSNSKGFPTNAIYGFTNMLLRVLDVEKPEYLVIAFDTPKPSFRKELYSDYKANRESPPEDLVIQIPEIMKVVDAFQIKRIQQEGAEADDVIGTLAHQAVREGFEVDIITGDKDLMQLVNEKITLYDTMKDKRIGPEGVVEKFGVKPHQVVDFLALMGDASDNIPGVTGIGQKTAADLLNQFESLDGIYQNVDKIKQEKRRQTLLAEKKNAYLSQKLAQIKLDLELDYFWDECLYRGPHRETLKELFEVYEFNQLSKRFNFRKNEVAIDRKGYRCISRFEDLKEVCHSIREKGFVSVDTETTSLVIQDAQLVGISLCWEPGSSVYIPIGHRDPDTQELLAEQLEEEIVKKWLKPILEHPQIGKVGQNLKYDYEIFKNWGILLRGIQADTLLESYVLNPDDSHGLDALAQKHLGHQNISYEEVTGKGKSQILFSNVTLAKATTYAAEDADVALRLHEHLFPQLEGVGLKKLFEEIEVPLVSVLGEMEYTGVKVNQEQLVTINQYLMTEIKAVEEAIFKLSGETFNVGSPKQLSDILFEKLKLPIIRKTKTGISTDESVLTELQKHHPICEKILKFRELSKLNSTYVEGLIEQIHPRTKRVHTSFNQTITATGRLSSSRPNLQNIPTVDDPHYDIRSVFIAEEGFELLSCDYSQVELRLLAHLSQDPELLRAFNHDEDVHEFTGRLIFGSDQVSPEQRKVAKTINFGVVYGQTAYGLSQTLGISPSEAKDFIDRYFKRYSKVKDYLQGLVDKAKAQGFAVTEWGRRRYLPEINSSNRMRREMAERAALNTPIQGTAADMIKVAMIQIAQDLKKEALGTRMILQVHDELVFEVPLAEREKLETLVVSQMESAMKLSVPLKVDTAWGKNWRECS